MPELPEVETVRRGLQRRIVGRRVVKVDVRLPKLVAIGPVVLSPTRKHPASLARRFERLLVGCRIVAVERRGKLLRIRLATGSSLLIHLKMAGQIIVTKPGERTKVVRLLNTAAVEPEELPSKHTHLVITMSGRVRLFYNDLRKFGTWRFIADEDVLKAEDVRQLGPDALDPTLDLATFRQRVGRLPRKPIKVALTDQTVVAGVGNIYADEALFRAKLHPLTTAGKLDDRDWRRLFAKLKLVLREAIRQHGSSVGDFVRVDGSWGSFGRFHLVYQQTGKPCRVCATPIKRITLAGRGTHFCPHCQARKVTTRVSSRKRRSHRR